MENLKGIGGGSLRQFPTYQPRNRSLGAPKTTVAEWSQTTAFYARVTFSRQPDLWRPHQDFSLQEGANHLRGWGVQGTECSSYFRQDFLDLGVVNTLVELGKTSRVLRL